MWLTSHPNPPTKIQKTIVCLAISRNLLHVIFDGRTRDESHFQYDIVMFSEKAKKKTSLSVHSKHFNWKQRWIFQQCLMRLRGI